MQPLVRTTLALRQAARRGGLFASALGLAFAVARDAESPFELPLLAALTAAWLMLFAWRCAASFGADKRDAQSEIEMGVLLVVATYGGLGRAEGGLSGP